HPAGRRTPRPRRVASTVMEMTTTRVNSQFPIPNTQGNRRRLRVGSWMLGVVVAALTMAGAGRAAAQAPNPAAAIAAARDAKAKTEAAQKKNSEALDPQRGAAPASAQPASPQPAPPKPPPGAEAG